MGALGPGVGLTLPPELHWRRRQRSSRPCTASDPFTPTPIAAQLNVLHSPLLEELAAAAQEWRPSLVYVYGGAPGSKEEIQAQTVGPLACLLDQQSGE